MFITDLLRWFEGLFKSAASSPGDTAEPVGTVSTTPAPGYERWPGARPEYRGSPADTILAVPGLDKWTPDDRRAVLEAAATLHVPVDSLVSVWSSESGLNPEAAFGVRHLKDGHAMKGPDGNYLLSADNVQRVQDGKKPFFAVGILQLTKEAHLEGFADNDSLLRVLGWTPREQIERIAVPLYRKMNVTDATPGRLYMLNFLPEYAGKPPDFVLGEESAGGRSASIYTMNRGFDTAGKGRITVEDVYSAVGRVVKKAGYRRSTVGGQVIGPAGPVAAPAPGASPAPPAPPPATPPTVAATRPAVAGGKKPWERFGPAMFDLVPLVVNGITLRVTRVPVYATASGIVVYPPFTTLNAREYGETNNLALPTAKVLDAMHLGGWFHEPIVGFYDVNKNMNTDDLVVELGRKWGLAFKNGGYSGSSGKCVVNVTKAWILSPAGIAHPGQGVNRGFYFREGVIAEGATGRSPIQVAGTAHPVTYTDLAQGGVFVSRDTDKGDYYDLVASGAFGDAPLNVGEFWRAAGA